MESNKYPDFREKKYNLIKLYYEDGFHQLKSRLFTFDPSTGRILLRLLNGQDGWVSLEEWLQVTSWPLARTGHWPTPFTDIEIVSEKEADEIDDNTVQ